MGPNIKKLNDKFRYEQTWHITVSGATKEAVRDAMSVVTAPSLGFQILRMKDIFSTSSGSTGIENRKENKYEGKN